MDLRLSPAQEQLHAHTARLLAREFPAGVGLHIEHPPGAADGAPSMSQTVAEIWKKLVGSDIVRLTLPELAGGMGAGLSEAVIVMEEMGKALLQSPYPDTITAAELIAHAGPHSAHWALLEDIVQGTCTIALAIGACALNNSPIHEEATLTIERTSAGWSITGQVDFVAFAGHVDYLAVVARIDGEPRLLFVPRSRPGIRLRRHDEIGRGELYAVTFDRAALAPQYAVDAGDAGLFGRGIGRARVRHAAYLLGMAQRAFDLTLHYTKERRQFGQRIASFQAIAFRLSALAARLEAARLLMHHVAWQSDRQIDSHRQAAELLALVGDLVQDVTAEAVQMHGAFGLTETAAIQRFYRCAAREALIFGSPKQLRSVAAALLLEAV